MRARLLEFINNHEISLNIKRGNIFKFSCVEIIRYYDFLIIIQDRYQIISPLFIKNTQNFQNSFDWEKGSSYLSDEQMNLLESNSKLQRSVLFEIESFYLFSKILLDKISRSTEYYFGQSRENSLDSHDKLVKNIKNYAITKEIIIPDELLSIAKSLKKDISDYRDYQIAHHKNQRTVRNLSYDKNNNVKMSFSLLYPNEEELQNMKEICNESKDFHILITEIEKYIGEFIEFILINQTPLKNIKSQN